MRLSGSLNSLDCALSTNYPVLAMGLKTGVGVPLVSAVFHGPKVSGADKDDPLPWGRQPLKLSELAVKCGSECPWRMVVEFV